MDAADRTPAPTYEQVERMLLQLITGKLTRAEAADWATPYVEGDADVADRAVWDALVALSGADLPSTDRQFLHGEADFCVWLERLRKAARP